MTTVAQHGLRWRFNGFPIYSEPDEWGEAEVIGYTAEPRWREAELTPEQLAEIDVIVAEHLAKLPQDSETMVRWATLDWNGIEHEHRKGKPVDSRRPALGYECLMCSMWVMAKDPGDSQFYGGPWDGRWVVTGGMPTIRVPVLGESMKVVEYRRAGDGTYRVETA